METAIIAFVAFLIVISTILTISGQRSGWGVAPLGILGLGFIIPFVMLLIGVL